MVCEGTNKKNLKKKKGVTATIRYIGPVHFAIGDWVGLKLDLLFEKAHEGGVVQKVRYFACDGKRGFFIKISDLIENGAQLIDTSYNLMDKNYMVLSDRVIFKPKMLDIEIDFERENALLLSSQPF